MSVTFLTGAISVAGKPCPSATVTCPTLALISHGGSFIGGALRAGSHVLTVHAPGHKVVTKKVTVGKPAGKAKVVDFVLKPLPPAKG